MDNDLISRAEAKEILYNCPNWLLVSDKDLALKLLDKVPAVNKEEG